MTLILEKETIIKGLQKAASISSQKSGAAFLKTIWLKWTDENLKIMATDSKIEFIADYKVNAKGQGLVGVNGKSFYELIKKLPPGEINITYSEENDFIFLKQGSKKYKIATYETSWFRDFVEFPKDSYIKWYGDNFKNLINRLYYFIDDDANTINKNLFLQKHKDTNKIVAYGTVAHSFAMMQFEHEELYNLLDNTTYMIDKMFLNELKKWLENNEIYLTIKNNRIFIKDYENNERISFPVSTKDDSNFEVFLEAFKDYTLSTLIVNRNELIDVLERLLIFASDIDELVTFTFEENKLLIHTEGHNKGEADEELNVEYSGDIDTVLFLIKRTKHIIEHFNSDYIKFEFTTFDGPCKITGMDEIDKGYVVVTMPVKLKEVEYYEDEVVESYDE